MIVTGPVSANALGTTLMHEHFVFGFPGWQGDIPLGGSDREEFLTDVCGFLLTMKSDYGLGTIVDATTNECGRGPELLREISGKTGINIICSTGYYTESQVVIGSY